MKLILSIHFCLLLWVGAVNAQTDSAFVSEPAMITRQHSFLHVSATTDKASLALNGIYANDSSLWFKLRVTNRSLLSYQPSIISFIVRDQTKAKRTAQQQVVLTPIYLGPDLNLRGKSSTSLIAGFKGFMLPRGKKLFIEASEQNGARALVLVISRRKLLRAKKLL